MENITRVNIHDINPKGQFTQWGNKENLENALPKICKQYADEKGKEIRSIEVEYRKCGDSYRANGYITLVSTEN